MTFHLEAFLLICRNYVELDEPELALMFMDNLPAYLRNNVPKQIVDLKKDILTRIRNQAIDHGTPLEYTYTLPVTQPMSEAFLKFLIREARQKRIYQVIPHPNTRWIFHGLEALDVPIMPSGRKLYVSFDDLPKMSEQDFLKDVYSHNDIQEYWISCPKYLTSGDIPFGEKKIMDLRGYTPHEFSAFLHLKLPHINWQISDGGRCVLAVGKPKEIG